MRFRVEHEKEKKSIVPRAQQSNSASDESEVHFEIMSNIDPHITTSWKDENWIIEKEHLKDFAVKLERRYNVKIFFAEESIKDYVFSGVIKNETLEQVLKAIYLTAPIEYKINEDKVTLYSSKRLQHGLKK